jgi:hypothetical protein
MARAAVEAQQMRLLQELATDALRLNTADRLYNEGDVRVASRMYVRLALSRPANLNTVAARQRLAKLADEAREKLKEIDGQLAVEERILSPSDSFGPDGPPTPEQLAARQEAQVTAAFDQYDELAEQYSGVPAVSREIKTHVAKRRARPEFAMVLNEPEAKVLWESGQEHENDDHLCCAYWVYKRAARLVPAPSAERARARLAEMEKDPQIVASAETCRELQICHKIYNRAQKLAKVKPARAKELFAEIVGRAPEDSEVYRAAREHVEQME